MALTRKPIGRDFALQHGVRAKLIVHEVAVRRMDLLQKFTKTCKTEDDVHAVVYRKGEVLGNPEQKPWVMEKKPKTRVSQQANWSTKQNDEPTQPKAKMRVFRRRACSSL